MTAAAPAPTRSTRFAVAMVLTLVAVVAGAVPPGPARGLLTSPAAAAEPASVPTTVVTVTSPGPPSASVDPAAGPPGTPIVVPGRGFPVATVVELRWEGSDGPRIGSAPGGDFELSGVVPDAAAGTYPLVVVSRDPDGVITEAVTLEFRVEPPDPGRSGPAGGTTGSTTVLIAGRPPVVATPAWVWGVIVLVLAGGALALVLTRPRSGPRSDGSGPGDEAAVGA